MNRAAAVWTSVVMVIATSAAVGRPAAQSVGNRAARLEWFRDLGFGMFIHWSVDSQIGPTISHSLVGA
ncbi:MAG: hypothetical protein ACRD1S_08580, partial [Vicinamibacterales bacterium]